ncbi:MAG: MFS transporter [Pseudomonadota bacterium]
MNRLNQSIIALNSFSTGILLPVFNLVMLERGSTLQTLPLLLAVYSATVLCMELPSGICADKYGRREVFLMSCTFQFIAFSLLLAADDMLWLVFAVIFHGLGRAFSSGSLDALIIDQALMEKGEGCLAGVTARMALLDGLGLAVGGIAGGLLADMAGSNTANIILRIVFCVVLFIVVLFFIKEQPMHEKEVIITMAEHLRKGKGLLSAAPGLSYLLAGAFFTGIFLTSVETYWQPAFMQLNDSEGSTWLLGVIVFSGFASVAVGNLIVQKLLEKSSGSWWSIYNACRLILAACISAFALQKGSVGFILWYSLAYMLLGSGNVAESTLINRLTPNNMRASILSLSSLLLQIGALGSSLLYSVLIMKLHFSGIWLLAGGLLGGYALVVTVASGRCKIIGKSGTEMM